MKTCILIYIFSINYLLKIFIYCDSSLNKNKGKPLPYDHPENFEVTKEYKNNLEEDDLQIKKKQLFKEGDKDSIVVEKTEENKELKRENKEEIKEKKKEQTKEENKEKLHEKSKEEIKGKNKDINRENKEEIKGENKEEIKENNKEKIKEKSKEEIEGENKEYVGTDITEKRNIEAEENEKKINEYNNNNKNTSHKSKSKKIDVSIYEQTILNTLTKYKEDMELYEEKLKKNELSEFYDLIMKRRNLLSINYKNEYLLKINYGKGYNFPLHNLNVVNEEKMKEKFYSNFTYIRDEDNSTLETLSYYSNLSSIDIDPTIFKEYYMKSDQCKEYLPLKSSFIEKICFVANYIKKNPYIVKVNTKSKKPLLYRMFLKIIKAFKKLSAKHCIKNVEESNLLDVLFIFNEELIKESKKELNLGKCINNIITRNKEWYEVFNFLASIIFGCSSYVKEHYYLNVEEKNEIYTKQKLIDLPIFDYLNQDKVDFFLPYNLGTKVDIDLYKDVSDPPPYKRAIFKTWYVCYLFIHKVYVLSKMWNLLKHWKAAKYVPKPWFIQHVGSSIIPHIISLYDKKKNRYIYFRYLDENQFFIHFKRSKKYPLPNFDKQNYDIIENIIAFQGTSSPSMWIFNLIYELSPYDILSKGKMHKGYIFIFEKAVKPYLDVLKESIQDEINDSSKYTSENPYTLVFTGHSFGAAMAQLSAFYMSKVMDVKNNSTLKIYAITFGLPTFYDVEFSNDFRNSGAIINNINVNYDPVHAAMAIPEINNFHNPDENNNVMITFNVEDLKHLNYDFGNNTFYGDEIFNSKNHHNHTMTHFVTKYVFKKNIFLDLRELHISQTHYFFYYVFLTLLSGWANEADWGTYFMVTYFLYDISNYFHNELMNKSKESYKKYKEHIMKKKLQSIKGKSKKKN
ncbi:lipase, putative [Plasmodium gallinaceum]|uniref:Lipase, putative n=1 Tax=Plasmodium gallinaceum TaxID=5849 RepID=A0A1J1GWT9_PLAGA|nr:lipase, putative [Plasmodium gallinaceum]CRG95773.1 lipase, putative [Plasmodium gallinaceum]